jgi:hypothetical protein
LLLPIFIFLSFSVLSIECNQGYEFKPRSGVGCVQIDCPDIPNAHYSYTGTCVCGSSGSINENPDDPNQECYRSRDYKDCPGCVYACVHLDERCPDDLEPEVDLPESFSEDEDNDNYVSVNPEDIAPLGSDEDRPNRPVEELSQLYIKQPNKNNTQKEYVYDIDELDEYACSPVEMPVFYKHKKTGEIYTSCACRPGFKRGDSGCVFDAPNIPLSDLDMKKLERVFLELQPNEHVIFESEYSKENIKIGIIRKNDYEFAFTVNGEKWDSNLQTLINPTTWQKTKKTWDSGWDLLNPMKWFNWHTKYKDEDKELKWQIADATLKRYDKDITKPKHYMYAVEYWYKNAEDKRQAAIKLRDYGLVSGSIDLSKNYAWSELKGNLEAFPANAVKELASEMRTDDFAQAFSIYARLRESKTPKDIINNPDEELELAISIGTASTLGDALLYQKYEEAYQRYLLAQKIKNKDKKN